MKLLPILLAAVGLLASPLVLAEEKHHHGHLEGETAEEHARHAHKAHDHAHDDKPQHGGIVAVANDLHYELVAADGKLALYAEGLPKGDALKSVKVRLTLLQGTHKTDLDLGLSKQDEHRFEVASDATLSASDKVVALIRLASGKPRLVRFEIPAK